MLKTNKIARQNARRAKLETAAFYASTRPVDTREATPDAIRTALAQDRSRRVCNWQDIPSVRDLDPRLFY